MYTFPLFVRFYGTVTRNEYLIRLEQEDNERRAGISWLAVELVVQVWGGDCLAPN